MAQARCAGTGAPASAVVEKRRGESQHRGDLLGVDAQRQRRHQRDAVAHQAHHQPDHEHDVQAGDRQDVGEAGIAHRLGDVLVDGGTARRSAGLPPRRPPDRAAPSGCAP